MSEPPPSRRTRATGERGATLAELLVTIAILATAVVAVLGAMATSFRATTVHRRLASAEAAVRSGAEAIKDRAVAYVDCAPPGAYAAELPAAPAGVSLAVSNVQYWDGASSEPASFGGSCPAGDPAGLQRITVQASSGSATESVTFVKRRT